MFKYIEFLFFCILVFQFCKTNDSTGTSTNRITFQQAQACCETICKENLKASCQQETKSELCDCGEECQAGPPQIMLEYGWTPSEKEWKSLEQFGIDKQNAKILNSEKCQRILNIKF
ncbi:hypothetical protein JWG45_05275 [Leptospira sp. 201903070]|uniref:Lipoprotein n=1 Tax=Leptospira ainlahdjerensis TaxID=2810033 RepID=A0ABS2U870_9LEPT|nr:hypothetical protein [Leptospira ainlahdjerensis]MBM9576561.1 hypothetical protein [Leptospira ainlahdjerensis]